MKITLKNINISRKLTIGLLTVLFSVSLISFFFIKETNELSKQTENIYNHPLTVRRAISDLKTNTLLMRVEFRSIILHSDVDHIIDAKERYNAARETALEQFEILFQRYLGPSVDIDLLYSSFVQWDIVQKDMLNRIQANKVDETLIKELESSYLVSAREELMNNIQRIEKFALNKADEFYNEANNLNANIKA